jgi:hypothetical protein
MIRPMVRRKNRGSTLNNFLNFARLFQGETRKG